MHVRYNTVDKALYIQGYTYSNNAGENGAKNTKNKLPL